MYKHILLLTALILSALSAHSQVELKIDLKNPGPSISPLLYGIFFEDINHAADGGLYAELIRNRSFEENSKIPNEWTLIKERNAVGALAIDTTKMLNEFQNYALKIVIDSTNNERIGASNGGYWGINVVNNRKYSLNFFARTNENFSGEIYVSLEDATGNIVYALDTISGLNSEWKKYSTVLTANGNDPKGKFVISSKTEGTIWVDVVSLFPPTFKNRPNGLRPDLAQMLVDLNPGFVRFPGGCFIEGDSMANAFRWKKTIGPIENRPGHKNLWNYRTSDGMGMHEFFELCEDLNAEPLYVTNVGMSHTDLVPLDARLDTFIQEALDAIEYANGSTDTKYGALRASNGHPEPFNLKYIEIGNENNFNQINYEPRYARFYKAIKEKYPEINCIANSYVNSAKTDIIDEHYYSNPQFFLERANLYDSYSNTQKIYVGEYAVTSECGRGNMIAALGEAAFMTGFERNSDVVIMSSYAPIFVNVNDRVWNPDMINFNASTAYGTPSYYVQKMFAGNVGDLSIPVIEKNNRIDETVTGRVGFGTWATQAEFDDVDISVEGTSIFSDAFSNGGSNWSVQSGSWSATSGTFKQSSTATDCRAVTVSSFYDTVYTFSFKAKKISGNEGFLIIFGYKDKNNFYWWNLGGWNNTRHAIEKSINGAKSVVSSTSGSIKLNQWYNIKLVFKPGLVECYLDDILVNKVETSSKSLYVSNSLLRSSNELITKVVNPYATIKKSKISINAITSDSIVYGTSTILNATGAGVENSFAEPNKIIPVSNSVENLPLNFEYEFPAYSVTILRLKIPNLYVDIKPVRNYVEKPKVSVYPNPVYGKKISIEIKESKGPVQITIYNLQAKKIYEKIHETDGKLEIYPDLKNGVFMLSVKGENIDESIKLMINAN